MNHEEFVSVANPRGRCDVPSVWKESTPVNDRSGCPEEKAVSFPVEMNRNRGINWAVMASLLEREVLPHRRPTLGRFFQFLFQGFGEQKRIIGKRQRRTVVKSDYRSCAVPKLSH